MPYNEYLADRVHFTLKENNTLFYEKKMFGRLCFFVDEKMCCGIYKEELMVRIDPENQDEYLQKEDCRMMADNKNSMKGFLMISPEGIDMDEDLTKWIKR